MALPWTGLICAHCHPQQHEVPWAYGVCAIGLRTCSCTVNRNQGHILQINKHWWLSKCSCSPGHIHTCTDSHQKKERMDSSGLGRAQYFYLAKPSLALKSLKTFSSYVCDIKVKHFPKHSWKDASCFIEWRRVFLNKNAQSQNQKWFCRWRLLPVFFFPYYPQ